MPGLTRPELVARIRQDFPELPILHIDDLARRARLGQLPTDVPTIYKPFSLATLTAAVRKLLVRE
jgi:CheY-like chemotaxis protein